MKMMALIVSLNGHGHLGMKAAHFYLLTDWHGPRDKICVLPQGAETDLLCVAKCAGGRRTITTELPPSTALQLQNELNTAPCVSLTQLLGLTLCLCFHISVSFWRQNWAWGMHKGSAWSTDCLSFAMRCKSLRLEFVFIANSNPGSSGKHRSHLKL